MKIKKEFLEVDYCIKNIKELFENYNKEYEPIEIDWGISVGNENIEE